MYQYLLFIIMNLSKIYIFIITILFLTEKFKLLYLYYVLIMSVPQEFTSLK